MKYFITLSFLIIYLPLAKAIVLDKTIASINNKMIFLHQMKTVKKEIQSKNMPDSLKEILYKNKNLLKNKRLLMDYLITRHLIFNKIKKYNLSVGASKVISYIEKIRNNYNLTDKQFVTLLKEKKINYLDYKKSIKNKLEINQFLRQFISTKIKIGQSEIQNYLKRKKIRLPRLDKKYQLYHRILKKRNSKKSNKIFNPWINIAYSEMSNKIKNLIKKIKSTKKPQIITLNGKHHLVKIKSTKKIRGQNYNKIINRAKNILFDIKFKSVLLDWIKKEKKASTIKIYI